MRCDAGRCIAFFADWQTCTDSREELLDPVRAQYREFFVLVEARYEGQDVMTCPYILVDQDVSLMRGLLQGFPKVIGSIHMTRNFAISAPATPALRPGGVFVGTVAAKDRRLVEATVRLQGEAPSGPRLAPIVNLRDFPHLGPRNDARASIAELVRSTWDSVTLSPIWTGSADMRFYVELHVLARSRKP